MPRPTPIIRKVLVTAAVLLAALAGGLVYVVQPIGWRSSGARPDGVDPVRLEAHVRMLGTGRTPATRVDLVAFTLEEPPYYDTEWMGSHVHAAALRREGVAVRAMIALEMIGYFSDAPGSQRLPHLLLRVVYPSTGNFVAVIGRLGEAQLARRVKRAMQDATDLDVYSMNAPAWIPGIDFSDHRSYWAQGYPAVMVTDTAFYRNDRYHTPRDTPDTLDYRRMADVVRGVHRAVLTLAR